jgi:hypothetical protein
MQRCSRTTLGVFFAILCLSTSACGAPESSEEAASTPAASESSTELPANFPEGFPLPPDFRITQAQFTEGDAMTQANFLVRGTSETSAADVAAFYRTRLPEAGYSVQGQAPPAGAADPVIAFSGDTVQNGSVQISAEGGLTSVMISLPLRD